ncbi:uncharacterized protein LOC135217297 [Macrobrachium nipponense]|uniref:uncharacterized protein LOC135217297 n=1 Tax=Macrobrachium nipponense TaxID=159736 RepID=UPI0030C83B21
MALLRVLEGVCELYENFQNDATNKTPVPSSLQPRVNIKRLTSADLARISKKPVTKNTRDFDSLSLFEEDGGFPFLGFGKYGEPTVQFPTLTRSLSKGFQDSSKKNQNFLPKININGHTKKRIVIKCQNILDTRKSVGSSGKTPHVQKESVSINTSSLSSVATGDSMKTNNQTVGNQFIELNMTEQIPIKKEINEKYFDDHDITIETEDFDYACSVNDRILSPPSQELHCSTGTNHVAFSENVVNESCGLSSVNRESFVFQECSDQANGLSRPNKLTELTTLLLELNNKNKNIDQKLARLKRTYEAKVSKVQQEKTANENKIQETLEKIQRWQEKLETCIDASVPEDEITTGTSTLTQDKNKRLNRGTSARKITGETSKENLVSSHSQSIKTESSCHDPEPIVSIGNFVRDIAECDDSISVESIDAELVCLSDLYSGTSNSFSDLESLGDSPENELPKAKKMKAGKDRSHENNLVEKASHFLPVVCLKDINSSKKGSIKDKIKCGSYIVVKLSSKKSVKHYCAVVRNKIDSGDYEVQYLERKNQSEFIFPEKEVVYKIEDSDIVQLLQDPTVHMKGLRLYYSFPGSNLDMIKSFT